MLPYLCDVLDEAETESLRRHLACGCPECMAALSEARSILGLLPLAMEPVQPPVSAHQNLMERVNTVDLPAQRSHWWIVLHWLIAALIGALAASTLILLIVKKRL